MNEDFFQSSSGGSAVWEILMWWDCFAVSDGLLVFVLEGGVLTALVGEEEMVLGENPGDEGHHGLITTFTDRDHREKTNIYSVTEL